MKRRSPLTKTLARNDVALAGRRAADFFQARNRAADDDARIDRQVLLAVQRAVEALEDPARLEDRAVAHVVPENL
jgi:hypothetical protein